MKQLTATLMSPQGETGKKFWEKIYSQAEKAGISNIPVDTFNKIWIVPQTGYFYEHNNSVFITDAKLKVMLEDDFVAAQKTMGARNYGLDSYQNPGNTEEVKQIIRSVIIPVIEQEVNEGEHFAPLRQVYNAMLLAVWFKKRIKGHLLSEVYVDQRKVSGIDFNDPNANEAIWKQYVETFKSGVADTIQDEYDPATQSLIPKKYFVGGTTPIKNIKFNRASLADIGKRPFEVDFAVLREPDFNNNNAMMNVFKLLMLSFFSVFLSPWQSTAMPNGNNPFSLNGYFSHLLTSIFEWKVDTLPDGRLVYESGTAQIIGMKQKDKVFVSPDSVFNVLVKEMTKESVGIFKKNISLINGIRIRGSKSNVDLMTIEINNISYDKVYFIQFLPEELVVVRSEKKEDPEIIIPKGSLVIGRWDKSQGFLVIDKEGKVTQDLTDVWKNGTYLLLEIMQKKQFRCQKG